VPITRTGRVEATGGVGDDVDEVAPVEVRFGPDEEQDVGPVAVTPVANLDLRPGQFGGDAVDDARDRSARALVDEVLGVEGREDLGVDGVEHRAHGVAGSEPGVDPAFETDHQDRLVELGIGQEDYSVVDLVVHQCCSKVCFAVSASIAICVGYSATLP
jgi:hypothetical protein